MLCSTYATKYFVGTQIRTHKITKFSNKVRANSNNSGTTSKNQIDLKKKYKKIHAREIRQTWGRNKKKLA